MWAGETHTPIAPGSGIYLPKGQVHCVENTGNDELRLLGVFYPAGSPECEIRCLICVSVFRQGIQQGMKQPPEFGRSA